MREVKDPEIKLFGKKIGLPENGKLLPVIVSGEDSGNGDVVNDKESSTGSDRDVCFVDKKDKSLQHEEADDESDYEVEESEKDQITGELSETLSEDTDTDQNKQMMEERENPIVSSESENSPKTPSIDEDSPTLKSSKTENDQHDATNSEQKTLKKPDKIVPCPRCNSMDTKFCYYNNYNVNQPRHFCKSCQRYWTAGGTMRNVPVGAGRRKNKNSASSCHHIMISEALQAARSESANGFQHATFKSNGTVLSFGPDSQSMASALNLAEKDAPHGIQNGFYNVKHKNSACKGGENGDDCSSTTSNSTVEGVKNCFPTPVMQNINGFPTPVPCLPGVPWPIPWNAAVPLPAICPTGFPMPFCPPPYWNCNMPGPWNVPWLIPQPPPTPNQMVSGADPNSRLGKHSREGDLLKPKTSQGNEPSEQNNSERSILIPKTLRIDDPDEAAKSSIWSTLGIEYDSVRRAGLFKSLQPKSKDKDHAATTSPVWQANPAALSRSLSFQERS